MMKNLLLSLSLLNVGVAIGNAIFLGKTEAAVLFVLVAIWLVLMAREYPEK